MHRLLRNATAAASCVALSFTVLGSLQTSASAGQPDGYGPRAPFDDALMGDDGPAEPMKDQSKIVRTKHGYRLTSGQQDNKIIVTLKNDRRLLVRDRATRSWKSLPKACTKKNANKGIRAVCRVPATYTKKKPMLLEIHPRLGDDLVDGRTMPKRIEMAVLADAGRDVVHTGAGNDFVNAAQDADWVHGNGGRDWIRGGKGNDRIFGGNGGDYLVGQDGRDTIRGGAGKDRIYQ